MEEEKSENAKEGDILSKLQSLPQTVQDYILSPQIVSFNESLIKKFNLNELQQDKYFNLLNGVFFKEIKAVEFIAAAEKEFGLGEKAKQFDLEVLKNIFLPLEDYLGGGVGDLIKNLGVDPKSIEVQRVEVKSLTAEQAAAEILLLSGLKFEEPSLAKRVQEIIEMRLREVRDDLETVAALVRGPKIGGIGLDEERAKKIIDSIKAKLLEAQIVVEKEELKTEPPKLAEAISPISPISPIGPIGPIKEVEPPITIEVEPPAEVQPPKVDRAIQKKIKKVIAADLSRRSPAEAEEEREVGLIKKELAKKMADVEIMTVEDAIKKIIKETGAEEKGADYVSKFRNILYARLRDIRDASETKEMLLKHPRLGGVGLTPEEIEKISSLIEGTFKALHQKKMEEITVKLKEEQVKFRKEKEERQKLSKEAEEKALDERWTGLTRKTVAADLSRRSPAEADKKFQPIKIEPALPQMKEIPKEMEDIRAQKVLTGPIEELGQFTLSDFRKLSQTPVERAKKIKEKVDLLAQEDITKKIAGVLAWKKSEVMRIYFDILKESMMTGKTISQIIVEKTAQNQPVLAEDEFKAIVELNRNLKV